MDIISMDTSLNQNKSARVHISGLVLCLYFCSFKISLNIYTFSIRTPAFSKKLRQKKPAHTPACKTLVQFDKSISMAKKQFRDFLTLSFITIMVGLIIVVAGIYFETNSLTSSGVTMGRYGRPYGTGIIDGKGMIFCGLIIAGFGLIFRDKKVPGDDSDKR